MMEKMHKLMKSGRLSKVTRLVLPGERKGKQAKTRKQNSVQR